MYKGSGLGSILSKGGVMWFVERKEVTFDVHGDLARVGMLDMVVTSGDPVSSPPTSKSVVLNACTSSPCEGGRWFVVGTEVTMSTFLPTRIKDQAKHVCA